MPGPWIFMCGVCLGALITIATIFVTLWRERLISKARIRNAYEKGLAQAHEKYDWVVKELDELWYEIEELQRILIKKENQNEL